MKKKIKSPMSLKCFESLTSFPVVRHFEVTSPIRHSSVFVVFRPEHGYSVHVYHLWNDGGRNYYRFVKRFSDYEENSLALDAAINLALEALL